MREKINEKDWYSIFRIVLYAFLVLVIAFIIYASVIIVSSDKTPVDDIYSNMQQATMIYDDNDKIVDAVSSSEYREIIKYDDIPENMRNAIVSIEDKTFWNHHGFNFIRIAGAIYDSVVHGDTIGGTSTLTQQLARNVFLSDTKSERSIKRKILESYYAIRIEMKYSKEEILEAYLNAVYFGYGCYGIDSAAEAYFSKKVNELTLTECAMLAALPQAPDTYAYIKAKEEVDAENSFNLNIDGLVGNSIAEERVDLVLDLMHENAFISAEDCEVAKQSKIEDVLKPTVYKKSDAVSYYEDYLLSIVASDLHREYGMSEESAEKLTRSGGLKIYSTLNLKAQKIIKKEFENNNNFPTVQGVSASNKTPQAAMVIVENGTGHIKAMVGGRNYKGHGLYNRAINPRQPGSSIKPLSVYSAALQKSFELQSQNKKFNFKSFGYDYQGASGWGDYITAASMVTDERMVVDGKVWPTNATGYYSGYNSFRTAIQQSINTCAVKIQLQLGSSYSADMLKKYGITTLETDTTKKNNDMNGSALALGGMVKGVTALEMALAYSVFPNGGVINEPLCYTRVEDADGRILLSSSSEKTLVIDPGVAWIMTDVLKSVVSRGIAYNASISGISVGGKTGTTNEQADIWFDGFTPKYAAALWIGTDDNKSMTSMSAPAAALWSKIMSQIPNVKEGDYKPMPSNVVYCGGEYYTRGTEPEWYRNARTYYNSPSTSGRQQDTEDDLYE